MSAPVPSIAVIMPALNAAAHVHAALASLMAQGVQHEAVLVDGGSQDETARIAAAQHVRVINAPGTSIYEALNRGIAETNAGAIALLNADDVLLPGALTAWQAGFARAPKTDIVCGGAEFVELDSSGAMVPLRRANARAAGPLTIDLVLRGPCSINRLCVRRSVFDRIGTFDTRYWLAADREWMLRAYRAGVEIGGIDRPVYRYLSHAGSSTMDRSQRNYAKIRREHLDIAARNLAGPAATDVQLARALRRWHAAEAGMLSWQLAKTYRFRDLAAILADAARCDLAWPLILAGELTRWLLGRRPQ
jgi:GT2 family glycosyltransferase